MYKSRISSNSVIISGTAMAAQAELGSLASSIGKAGCWGSCARFPWPSYCLPSPSHTFCPMPIPPHTISPMAPQGPPGHPFPYPTSPPTSFSHCRRLIFFQQKTARLCTYTRRLASSAKPPLIQWASPTGPTRHPHHLKSDWALYFSPPARRRPAAPPLAALRKSLVLSAVPARASFR